MAMGADGEGSENGPDLRIGSASRQPPFVQADEDVPHGGALPDLYGVAVDEVLEEAIESGRLCWSVNLMTGETVLSARVAHSNV